MGIEEGSCEDTDLSVLMPLITCWLVTPQVK